MNPLLAAISPNIAILLLTAGAALIALELNRPGSILPGAAGLLVILLAMAGLIHLHPFPVAVAVLVCCIALLLLQWRRYLHWLFTACITAALILALLFLEPRNLPQPSAWIAVPCGLILGVGTTVLTRMARRARQNKGLD